MKARALATMVAMALLASVSAANAELASMQVHLGAVDLDAILDGTKAVPLIEPTIRTEPSFSPTIRSYTVRVPDAADGITLVLEQAFAGGGEVGVLDLNGVAGEFRGVTYSQSFRDGAIFPVPLQPGENRLRLGTRDSPISDIVVYELLITRQAEISEEPAISGNVALAALALSREVLSPPFDGDVLAYSTWVAGDKLVIDAQASPGASVSVQGIGPAGQALATDGFTVLGLHAGENMVIVSVNAGQGATTRHYLVRAMASDVVHRVSEGDRIAMPEDCDERAGCNGTLNGVQGRFACDGENIEITAGATELAAEGFCAMGLSSDGDFATVTSAVGWFFWALPE